MKAIGQVVVVAVITDALQSRDKRVTFVGIIFAHCSFYIILFSGRFPHQLDVIVV